ncbi:CapA family protein [Patescibacteria group bacterium]|nr:CapA family protein [Patescibacteria group bacterium]
MKKIHALTWVILTSFLMVMVPIAGDLSASSLGFPMPMAKTVRSYRESWVPKRGFEPVNILFTGDIMLGRYIEYLRSKKGGDFPFTNMPAVIAAGKSALAVDNFDLVVGNLEGPITSYGRNVSLTTMVFNFKPEVAPLLKKVGFTTLSMANNHVFNQGRQGLSSTHEYLTQEGLKGFGHPDTESGEYSFIKYDFKDMTVGFLGLDDVDFKLNMPQTLERIRELDKQVDFLIIGVHWGTEYLPEAPASIVEKGHQFVDAGADFIWGHHPHVIQNWEVYNGAPIYYSLGNFVFDQYWSQKTQEGLVVALQIGRDDQITTKEIYVDLINQGEPAPRTQN